MLTKAFEKYLASYAEPESRLVQLGLEEGRANSANKKLKEEYFDRALVIPVYDETRDFIFRLLQNWGQQSKLLVILVLNRPDNLASNEVIPATKFVTPIKEVLNLVDHTEAHLSWCRSPNHNIRFLLMDRCSDQPIPAKQGVGLARKIGCDIALRLHEMGVLRRQWVHTTDADAHLPANYFDIHYPHASALVYPHTYALDNTALSEATQIYDASTRNYQEGLAYAGSPYAYNPTGSLMALNLNCYAAARGFPKRAGGEDFYLLNKLQKLKGVVGLDTDPIELECRASHRVPFGTGPAVSRLLEGDSPADAKIFYHPKCFQVLKQGLLGIRQTQPKYWFNNSSIPQEFLDALQSLGTESAINHLSARFESNQSSYLEHLDLWFDAFKSLKAVHYLRDNHFSNISYTEWKKLSPS